ncbi:MAG TPA: ComEC/Rec2 family competence protein [Ruminococcus sp.]|nr:ComEC/Rec2 family competence protein [Ruminococcus sp.]
MKRKMIGAASAYIAGLFFASFFTGNWYILLPAALFILLIGRLRKYGRYDYIVIASFFILGTALSYGKTAYISRAEREYSGETFTFTGTVEDIRKYSGGKVMYTLKGRSDGRRKLKVRLYTDDKDARYGDRIIAVNCEAVFPESDYLYDSKSSFRAAGISFTLDSPDSVSIEHTGRKRLKNAAMSYRDDMISEMRIVLGEERGSFLAGMVFGQKQGLDENTKTSLYRSGIGHIMAVSGLHISIIAAAVMCLWKMLGFGRLESMILTDSVAAVMILLADSPVSAIRAAIMMNFLYAAGLFRRQNDTFNSLAAAVLLIGLADPGCIYSSGFILSVAGTFGIGVFGPFMTKKFKTDTVWQKLFRQFVIMLCTSVFIMPFSMLYFGETSLISPITNIVLLPFCTFVLLLGVIYVFSMGALPVLPAAGAVIRALLRMTDKLSGIGGTWFASGSDMIVYITFILGAAAALVMIVTGSRRYTAVAIAAGCSIVFISSAISGASMYNTFTAAVLGKESNAAVVITYRGETEVIDLSGHYRSPEYVSRFLKTSDISSVDTAILTRDVQSQYSAYSSALGSAAPERWIISGDTPIYGESSVENMGSGGCVWDNGGRSIEYNDGVLTISASGRNIVIVPAGKLAGDISGADMVILYGKSDKEYEFPEGCEVIYLDKKEENSLNNFTVTISGSGRIRKRRL